MLLVHEGAKLGVVDKEKTMTTNGNLTTHKTAARIFGVLFLGSFLAYGIGGALIESLASAPDMLVRRRGAPLYP